MTILFDLIDTQDVYRGSGVYIHSVFLSTVKYLTSNNLKGYNIVCVYDSTKKILYDDLMIERLSSKVDLLVIDIQNTSFKEIIELHSVDVAFFGFGQIVTRYNLDGLKCRIICVLHDIYDLEFSNTKLEDYIFLFKPLWMQVKRMIKKIIGKSTGIHHNYAGLINLFSQNDNYQVVTVSRYSFYSLINFLPIPESKITVLYSPEKLHNSISLVENDKLKDIISSKIKYFLIVSADRALKNASKAIYAFKAYVANGHSEVHLVTLGYPERLFENHHVLPYLSESDLEHAYKNSFAFVYPSLFEGFGYPPLEAMKYGIPVLCSNVCSMPEVLGDAPIYFSPFYQTDIYSAIDKFMVSDYSDLSNKSKQCYKQVQEKQNRDLEKLIQLIIRDK